MPMQSGIRVHRRGAKSKILTADPLVVGAEPLPPKRHLTIDPSLLPDEYVMICEGKCLEPEIADNTKLLFSASQPYAPGDFICIYFKPEFVKPGHHQALVKRLVLNLFPGLKFPYKKHPDSNVMPVIITEMFNPPMRFAYPADAILAIHKCLGPVPAGMTTYKVSDAEIVAMSKAAGKRGRVAS